jgi:hypothetical protein
MERLRGRRRGGRPGLVSPSPCGTGLGGGRELAPKAARAGCNNTQVFCSFSRFSLRGRPICVMVPAAPMTRSGGGERFRRSLPPLRKPGAESAGAVIHRPAGTNRHSSIGGRSAPAAATSLPVARRIWRAGANPRVKLDLIQDPRGQAGRRFTRGGVPHERTAPTPETDHRASSSRNGSLVHHLWWHGWRARRCIPSPAGRALSRKPFQPPDAARPTRGRAAISGGTPEFRTE